MAISQDAVKRKFRTFYRESEFDLLRSSHQQSSVGKKLERKLGIWIEVLEDILYQMGPVDIAEITLLVKHG